MRLAAVILAAGRSRRFGSDNKLLAHLGGEPVLVRTARSVAGAGFDDVIAVAGADGDAVRDVLRHASVRWANCADDLDGMGYSIAAGVSALTCDIDGVAIVPGDMPLITSASLRTLVSVFGAQGGRRIVHAADAHGRQRNPVIWPRTSFASLRALEGTEGAKSLIHNAIAVRVSDRELLDIDLADDLVQAQNSLKLGLVQS